MLTTIDQFAGQDIWVYAELEYEDAYIRIEKIFDDGTVIYNAWLPSDSLAKYDLDEILYGELTGDVDSIEIHPLDTLTTEELISKIKADGKISGCSKVTSSRKFTKYPANYVKASIGTYTDSQLEQMWLDLTDVPFDETEDGKLVLAEDWKQFPAGTDREDIWYFFDENYSKGVAYLLYNYED